MCSRCGFGVKPESKYAFAKKLFDIFIMYQRYVHRRISAKRVNILKIKAQQKIKHYTSVYSEGRKYQFSGTLLISVKHISVKLIMLKKLKIRGQQRQNTTHVPNKRKQRQNKISVGYDIPNIDQLHDDHIEDDPEEMNDCDVDIEGIIEEIDADLEFDVSSQETTDSENDDLSLDVSNANITYPFRQEVKRKTKPLRKSSICKSRGI
ncbi:unnamed protein product [Brassica oleracea]